MTKKLLVFHQLQVAHSALFRAADQRSRNELGLTSAQLSVLIVLSRTDGLPISSIAKALAMGKSSLTGLIDRMCEKGLVRREASAQDGRIIHIHIESSGRQAAQQGIGQTQQYNHELLAPFSIEEQKTIQRFLQHLSENADSIINKP